MFNRQIKEDLLFHKSVLRRFERLINQSKEDIIDIKERLELYEEREKLARCKCNNEVKEKE